MKVAAATAGAQILLRWAQRLATSRQLAGCVGSARGCSDGAVWGHRSGHGFCNFIASVGIRSAGRGFNDFLSKSRQEGFRQVRSNGHQTRLGAIAHGLCNFIASVGVPSAGRAGKQSPRELFHQTRLGPVARFIASVAAGDSSGQGCSDVIACASRALQLESYSCDGLAQSFAALDWGSRALAKLTAVTSSSERGP